jgi:hypothetical protein
MTDKFMLQKNPTVTFISIFYIYILFCEISQKFYTFALHLYYTLDDGRTTEACSVKIILLNTGCDGRNIHSDLLE